MLSPAKRGVDVPQKEVSRYPARSVVAQVAVAITVIVGLMLSATYSYTLFHTLAEAFAVVVAAGAFMVAWNARRFIDNDYILFLGVSLLFVAFVDLLHTISYRGMGILPTDVPGGDLDLPTQLWLAGRYLQVSGFLLAPLFVRRRVRPYLTAGLYALVTAALLISIVPLRVFPTALTPEGLTPFKIASEYAIVVGLAVAARLLWRHRAAFASNVHRLLLAAIAVTAMAELAFTLYTDPFGPANMVGHLVRIVAFYLTYRAIIGTALSRPYSIIFRELKQSETRLRREKRLSDALNLITLGLSSSLEPDAVLRGVAEQVEDALGARQAGVSVRLDDREMTVHGEGGDHLHDEHERLHEALHALLDERMPDRRPVLVSSDDADERLAAVMGHERTGYAIAAPVIMDGRLRGMLSVGREAPFDRSERDFVGTLGVSISLAMENATHYEAEHRVAEILQESMSSVADPSPDLDVSGVYRSSASLARIGGDFYDLFAIDERHTAFCLGDVSGKGLDAAALTQVVRSIVRAFVYLGHGPADVLTQVNASLFSQLLPEQFVTAVLGVIDTETGAVTIAGAGHPDIIDCRSDGYVAAGTEGGTPLGMFRESDYRESTMRLGPGETLLMFTDGLLELRREDGTFFGEGRVFEVLDALGSTDPRRITAAFSEAVERFTQEAASDDIAILAVSWRPSAS